MALSRIRLTRTRLLSVSGVTVALAATLLAQRSAAALPENPAQPPTTIGAATAALTQASREAEGAAEAYNLASGQVNATVQAAAAAQRVATVANAAYARERAVMSDLVRVRYEGHSLGTAGALLDSTDASALISRAGTLSAVSSRMGATIAQVGQAKLAADRANAAATARQRDARTSQDQAKATLRAATDRKANFQRILSTLSAAQLAQYNSGTIPPEVARGTIAEGSQTLTSRQKTIIDYVQAQVGKPYVFAAAGPDAYDCSGLVKAAYALLGFSLTHYAPTQYTASGNHPSSSQLQPGDLVFLYPDIGHVEIYIGNGIAVSAADEELGIRYVNVFADMGSYFGATRLL